MYSDGRDEGAADTDAADTGRSQPPNNKQHQIPVAMPPHTTMAIQCVPHGCTRGSQAPWLECSCAGP